MPKPIHGWREFINEVGIIIIGVGIALAAEQAIETAHWNHVVAEEDAAMVVEIRANHAALLARVMMQPCIDRRLAELGDVFRRHDAGQPLGLIAPIGRPTTFTGGKTTLAMATADQSLSHMSLGRKAAIFDTYGSYDVFIPVANEERSSWRSLQALNHAASLDQADWRDLRKAFDAVTDNNITMKANLQRDRGGQWLTPFAVFPKLDSARLMQAVHIYPYVQQLCRPAIRHLEAGG